jgi:hypothetical protein
MLLTIWLSSPDDPHSGLPAARRHRTGPYRLNCLFRRRLVACGTDGKWPELSSTVGSAFWVGNTVRDETGFG